MWRPSRPGGNTSAYEHNTRYNLQPAEDRDTALQKGPSQTSRRPNYKPTALRWYFIICQIVLLSVMIALVAYARLRMPDSDSTAVIEKRSEGVGGSLYSDLHGVNGQWTYTCGGSDTDAGDPLTRRDERSHTDPALRLLPRLEKPPFTSYLAPRATPSAPTSTLGLSDIQFLQDQSASLSPLAEQEKYGKEIDVTVPRVPCDTSTLCVSSITTSIIITVVVPEQTLTVTNTSMSTRTTVVPVTTTTVIPGKEFTSSQVTTVKETTEVFVASAFTLFPTAGPNNTALPPPQATTQTYMSESVITKSTTVPILGSEPPETKTITKSSKMSEVVPIVTTSLSVAPAETYFSLGPTVIEVTYTPAARGGGQAPVTHIVTTVEPGRTVTEVVRQAPVEVVVGGEDRVETRRVEQRPQAVMTRVGGTVTDVVVVITPSPLSGDRDGREGGSGGDDSNGDGGNEFRPVSLTVVSEVGGELQTFTVQDAPQTAVITHADGSVETTVTTPPPRITTSRAGGSLTILEIATTPTGTELISFTVVSTIGGTLKTITTTPPASKVVTTISGTPSTIISTPSSTRTSIIDGTTKTVKSVSTPTPTAPTDLNAYNVDASKYFIGKFLPPLLATLLAIPLRVIDLNAKLYQPFYALNAENGALGAESMTLHFNGLNALTKPFALLFEGRPMTFITSVIFLCSSLTVPLAAEALGLKIHGRCTEESIQGCALDLGVSPGPAHALLALLALTVTLLFLLLLLLMRNQKTGLFANPWSIAGIASLARCADVRLHALTNADIRHDMSKRRYGLGFFRNVEGRDEYGIVLYDDSGRNLRGGQARDGSDSEDDLVYNTNGNGRATRRVAGRRMPLMALGYPWRIAFILFLLALFVVILYYHVSVLQGSSPRFKRFMNSHNFGARFFFAGVGVVITFAWLAFFVSKPALPLRFSPNNSQFRLLVSKLTSQASQS